ncbi:MAG: hypothetical protein WCX73_00035 [Candidatus Pacearchaeota archaeon]|jgi:hypothetical protein
MKNDSINNRVIENIWIKQNSPQREEQIEKDLVTNLTLPNYQFVNPFHYFGETLGYSIHSELSLEGNENKTIIKVKSYFSIPENVPSETELITPKGIIAFLEKREFKKVA